MGRAWRIEGEGGLYHVLSRGNERNDIFAEPESASGWIVSAITGALAEAAEAIGVLYHRPEKRS